MTATYRRLRQGPQMAATYDIYMGIAKEPVFDWRAEGAGLAQIALKCRVASGLRPLVDVGRAIESGEIEGRKLDWAAWIAPVSKIDLPVLAARRGWKLPPEVRDL